MPATSAKPVSTGPGHRVVTADAGAAQLGAQGASVGEHEGLGRAVAGLSGQRLEGGGRRGVRAPRRDVGSPCPGTNSVHRSTTASTFVRTMASSAARSALGQAPIVVKPALLTRMSGVRPRAASSRRELAARVGIGEVGRDDLGADGVRAAPARRPAPSAGPRAGPPGSARGRAVPAPGRSPPRCPTRHR